MTVLGNLRRVWDISGNRWNNPTLAAEIISEHPFFARDFIAFKQFVPKKGIMPTDGKAVPRIRIHADATSEFNPLIRGTALPSVGTISFDLVADEGSAV
jgi:hypothetical protein